MQLFVSGELNATSECAAQPTSTNSCRGI